MTESEPELLTAKEAAALLRVPISWLYARTHRGTKHPFPAGVVVKLGGGNLLRFDKRKLLDWAVQKRI